MTYFTALVSRPDLSPLVYSVSALLSVLRKQASWRAPGYSMSTQLNRFSRAMGWEARRQVRTLGFDAYCDISFLSILSCGERQSLETSESSTARTLVMPAQSDNLSRAMPSPAAASCGHDKKQTATNSRNFSMTLP